MSKRSCSMVASFAIALSVACDPIVASQPPKTPVYGGTFYTLTALHPDEEQRKLYSVNYQRGGLIPMCTQVRIESVDNQRMMFSVVETRRSYEYVFHDSMVKSVTEHLAQYFGENCQTSDPPFTPQESKAIRTGTIEKGMRKAAVIRAAGYPPEHMTPTLEKDVWIYWINRFDRIAVQFENDRVADIRD